MICAWREIYRPHPGGINPQSVSFLLPFLFSRHITVVEFTSSSRNTFPVCLLATEQMAYLFTHCRKICVPPCHRANIMFIPKSYKKYYVYSYVIQQILCLSPRHTTNIILIPTSQYKYSVYSHVTKQIFCFSPLHTIKCRVCAKHGKTKVIFLCVWQSTWHVCLYVTEQIYC